MFENINKYLDYFYEAVTLEFVFKFAVVYFFIIWIALIVWVMKDISIRTNNLFFQLFCILTVLILTPFGIFIYLLVRPGKTLYERYYDEIDLNLDVMAEIIEERKKITEDNKVLEKKPKKDILKELDNSIKKVEKTEKIEKKVVKKQNPKKTQIKVKKF